MYQIRMFTGVRIWWNIGRSPGSWRTKAGHRRRRQLAMQGLGISRTSRQGQPSHRVACNAASSKRGASWTTPLSQFSVPNTAQHSAAEHNTARWTSSTTRYRPRQCVHSRPQWGHGATGREVHLCIALLQAPPPGVIIQCAMYWVGPPFFPSESC